MPTGPAQVVQVRSGGEAAVDHGDDPHDRVMITKNGKPLAVLISAQDLESLEETLFWVRQEPTNEEGPTVGIDVVASDLKTRQLADRS